MTTFVLQFETPHSSSIIDCVEWNEQTKIMIVTFKSGDEYQYENVSKDVINLAMNAESVGSYLRREVFDQPTKYPYLKI